MRTKITDLGYGIHLQGTDPYDGSAIDEVFRANGPMSYVRRDSDGEQCFGSLFGNHGGALQLGRDGDLIAYIRREWAEYRRKAQAALSA